MLAYASAGCKGGWRKAVAQRAGLRHLTPMPLYFAYGSNMDLAAMAARCPRTRPLGNARLARHRFLINEDGYATVVRDPRSDVHGVLFDLAFADVPALDRYEGLGQGLYSKIIQPVLAPSGARKAMVYIGRSSRPGTPRPGYLEGVIAAAKAAGLPAAYIAAIGGKAEVETAAPTFKALGQKGR